jgi:hypothetical protein
MQVADSVEIESPESQKDLRPENRLARQTRCMGKYSADDRTKAMNGCFFFSVQRRGECSLT